MFHQTSGTSGTSLVLNTFTFYVFVFVCLTASVSLPPGRERQVLLVKKVTGPSKIYPKQKHQTEETKRGLLLKLFHADITLHVEACYQPY